MVSKTCKYCNGPFQSNYNFQVYCSQACRDAWIARNRSTEQKEQRSKWRKDNYSVQSHNDRKSYLKRKFGITPEQYTELLEQQNGACAVCKKDQSEFTRRFAIDHDHQSGEIRGLLCNFCNHRVVGRHKRGGLLKAAADYLERKTYTGWLVPEKKKKRKKRGKNPPSRPRQSRSPRAR